MSDEQVSELRYIEELEAEVEKLREEPNVVQYRQLERERDETRKQRDRYRERAEAAEAKLAEVEKERDKWRRDYEDEVNDPYRDAFMQDIQRARELVEELITPPVTRSPWPAGAQEDLQTIARLLSGKAE